MGGRTKSALTFLIALTLIATGCALKRKEPPSFGMRVAKAHGYTWWKGRKEALAADVHLTILNENPDLNRFFDAQFTYDCATGRTRMQLRDDTVIIYDGQKTWVSPADSKVQKARFLVRTWPFMVAAPLRLFEPNVTTGPVETRPLAGRDCPTAKLSFTPGADRAADDWCIAYADPKNYRLIALTCSLKGGKGVDGFSEDALAVTYYGFKEVEGVLFATEWRIWKWNKDVGIYDKPVAEGRVYNIAFTYPKKSAFDRPPGSREATE